MYLIGRRNSTPILLSTDYFAQADTLGGETVVLNGTSLSGALTCLVGGVSATKGANTAGSLAFTMPAITHDTMPSFDGIVQHLENAGPITNFVTTTSGSIGIFFYARAAAAATPANAKYQEPALFGDDNGNLSLSFSDAGCAISSFDGSTWNCAIVPCSTREWHYVQARWNTTVKEIRIDGGAWQTITHSVAGLSAGLVHLGRRYTTGGAYLDAIIGSVMTESARWSDVEADQLVTYINTRFRQNYNSLGNSTFDPTARSLTCWLDAGASFAASTWTGQASAGISSTHSFTQASNPAVASNPPWVGYHDVRVTTPVGTSNALTIEAWCPTDDSAVTLLFDAKSNPYNATTGIWVPRYTIVGGSTLGMAPGSSSNFASDGAGGVVMPGVGAASTLIALALSTNISLFLGPSVSGQQPGSYASVFSSQTSLLLNLSTYTTQPYTAPMVIGGAYQGTTGLSAFTAADDGLHRIGAHAYGTTVGYIPVSVIVPSSTNLHSAVSRWHTDTSLIFDLCVDGALSGSGYASNIYANGTTDTYTNTPLTSGGSYNLASPAYQTFTGVTKCLAVLNAHASDTFVTKHRKWAARRFGAV